METVNQECRRWRTFGCCLVGALSGVLSIQAALVDLDAMVTYSIYDQTGSSPLVNGSVVYIVGSIDGVMDPMDAVPSGGTNLIAASTTGDDVLLGWTTINSLNTGSNGTFFTTLRYESTAVNFVYIRFFDFTNIPVGGLVYWGTSAIHQLSPTPTLGVNSVDFNPNATLVSSNLNNFIVVPEPNTANLLILVAGMAWAMRASMKGAAKKKASQGDEKP